MRSTRASADAWSSGTDDRRPALPDFLRSKQGLPGYWVVLWLRAVLPNPAGYVRHSPVSTRRTLLPSASMDPWAPGTFVVFEANFARPTRSPAYASPVSLPSPSQGSASGMSGLTLYRTGFAPAGQLSRFLEAIASSYPPRPAGPGRTMVPTSQKRLCRTRKVGAFQRIPPLAPYNGCDSNMHFSNPTYGCPQAQACRTCVRLTNRLHFDR